MDCGSSRQAPSAPAAANNNKGRARGNGLADSLILGGTTPLKVLGGFGVVLGSRIVLGLGLVHCLVFVGKKEML